MDRFKLIAVKAASGLGWHKAEADLDERISHSKRVNKWTDGKDWKEKLANSLVSAAYCILAQAQAFTNHLEACEDETL